MGLKTGLAKTDAETSPLRRSQRTQNQHSTSARARSPFCSLAPQKSSKTKARLFPDVANTLDAASLYILASHTTVTVPADLIGTGEIC